MDPVVFAIIAAVLSGLAVYAVALPLLAKGRSARPSVESAAQEELNELLAQRDAAFQALRELNFDHRLGKISAEDFVQFEGHLKLNAANTLRALDAWEACADEDLDDMLEQEIRARRATLTGEMDRADTADRPCPACGLPVAAADQFCSHCGQAVARIPAVISTPTCPGCGAPAQPNDRFCAKCGRAIAEVVSPIGS